MRARPRQPDLERDHGDLVRRVLRTERGLRRYRPTIRSNDPPPEPPGADQVLAAVASRFEPGDAVGIKEVLSVIAVTYEQARAVRQWAEHPAVGAWPYLRPSNARPAGSSDPDPSSRRAAEDRVRGSSSHRKRGGS